MKISIFTSNQPRHLALVNRLALIADSVFVVQECTTCFPGLVDDFYRKSETMQRYFAHVIAAEKKVFGSINFLPNNVRGLSLRMGDLSLVDRRTIEPALGADIFIVFGSSWIRGPLLDALIDRSALNLHMGISPFYRGTACNFWAAYDRRYEYIGGTIHKLSRGLDSGPILQHALPPLRHCDAFEAGMLAVDSTHQALAQMIADGRVQEYSEGATAQDKSREIRYTRNKEFTDEIAVEYLGRIESGEAVRNHIDTNSRHGLVRPHFWQPEPTKAEIPGRVS